MAGRKLGFNAKMWVKAGENDVTTALGGSPPASSEEWTYVADVTVSDSFTEVSTDTRRMGGLKTYEPGMRDISLSVPIKKDAGDAAYAIVKTAAANRTPISVWILDGPEDNDDSEGIAFNAKVYGGDEDQTLDDVVGKSLTIKPCDSQYAATAISGSSS